MKTRLCLALALLAALPGRGSAELRLPTQAELFPAEADYALVVSGFSWHFRQNRDYRGDNPGLGLERSTAIDGLYMTAGYFRNSYDKNTFYVGARYMPLQWRRWRGGAYLLLGSGYPSPVLPLPGIAFDGKRIGLNIVFAPTIGQYSGYIGGQLRWKF